MASPTGGTPVRAAGQPDVCIAVATRHRPLRLRWLLNALAEQTLPSDQFEVIVACDPSCEESRQVLETHPLRDAGLLHSVSFPPESTFPGAGRNASWAASRAPLVLFTDDDCRPDARWAEVMLDASRARPGTVLQGRTCPDPDEAATLHGAPWVRTLRVDPPNIWAPTCNMAYPRDVLERAGGFNASLRVGEDTDLAQRARRLGAGLAPVAGAVVYHAVDGLCLPKMLRTQAQWSDLAYVVKQHPVLRRALWGRVWWKPEHAALVVGLAAVLASRRDVRALPLTLPWLALAGRHRGYGARGLLRSCLELPGRAAIDLTEVMAMARGSLRHQTLVL